MAQIFIHPTAATPGHITAIQAQTGRIAVFSATGAPRLIAAADHRRHTDNVRRHLRAWITPELGVRAEPNLPWPDGAA